MTDAPPVPERIERAIEGYDGDRIRGSGTNAVPSYPIPKN